MLLDLSVSEDTGAMLGRIRSHVRSIAARRFQIPEIPGAMERLRAQGVQPRHVFDVGAYRGDFARLCLRTWPQTRVTCFEPLPQVRERLRGLEAAGRVSIYPCLLGSRPAESVKLHARDTASSVLEEHHEIIPTIECEQRTIDDVIGADFADDPPDVLKIDVQGYELDVLKGGGAALAKVRLILAEVNLLDIHKGVPLLADIVFWLAARDFVAFDVAGFARRPLDGALWQMDMVFVRSSDPLRTDKRWG